MTATAHDPRGSSTATTEDPRRSPDAPSVVDRARETLSRATDHLLSLQQADGWWKGELETNVTIEAEDLLLRHFLGILRPDQAEPTARWIRGRQRSDGTWATFYGGPADLSTSVEAYAALRLAGDLPDAPHMTRAAGWIRDAGGIPATRVFTRIWLALFGLWQWERLPVIPPELVYLPRWVPLNLADWGCWARQTIVPLAVVAARRPVRALPFRLDELMPASAVSDTTPAAATPITDRAWFAVFGGLDRALAGYHRLASGQLSGPARTAREAALRRCAEWIIARQEADGSWGGIQPPWVYSLIALNLLGYPVGHPVMRKGLDGLDSFTVTEDTPDGPVRRIEACQSPVWDTVLAITALADAGLPPGHRAIDRAARWVIGEEIRCPGDWQVRRPRLAPGGWAFEFENDGYPDTDDTAEVLLALRRTDAGRDAAGRAAIDRGLAWMTGMQCRDGGWGAFDADNTRQLVRRLPFCDFGEVIDPPSADVTAHIVEALAAEGLAGSRATRRGVAWLLRNQEPDGSWFGRWGANYVYGTGAVVPALIAAGVRPGKPPIQRALAWLLAHQNADGGWGEDLRSYREPGCAGKGASTASQTAWALLALLCAPDSTTTDAISRAVLWLADTQRADGTWDEPQFTGTGFPGDFYINYHLYRLVFPVSALGRYVCQAPPRGAS